MVAAASGGSLHAIHYHVRSEGQSIKKAVYIVIGIKWVGENESAKFWAMVPNSPKNRGIENILISCMDNRTGLAAAIEAVFPKTGNPEL